MGGRSRRCRPRLPHRPSFPKTRRGVGVGQGHPPFQDALGPCRSGSLRDKNSLKFGQIFKRTQWANDSLASSAVLALATYRSWRTGVLKRDDLRLRQSRPSSSRASADSRAQPLRSSARKALSCFSPSTLASRVQPLRSSVRSLASTSISNPVRVINATPPDFIRRDLSGT